MNLVLVTKSTQNRNRVLDIRLSTINLLETPLQCGIFFYVLPIFVESRGTNRLQFTSSKGRFEQIACVHATFTCPSPYNCMKLIDEKNYLPLRLCDFGDYSLQSLLKLTAEFCTGNKASHVQRKKTFVFKAFRDIPACDSAGKTFDNCRLSDSRLTNQNRIILCSAYKNLHYAADFFIAANYRVNFVLSGTCRQISAIFFESLHFAFRVLRINFLVSADALQGFKNRLFCDSVLTQKLACTAIALRHSKKNMLHRKKLVFKSRHFLFGFGKNFLGFTRKLHLNVSGNMRICLKKIFCRFKKGLFLNSNPLDYRNCDSVLLFKHGHQKMWQADF